jgi:hypothetical protein
VRGLAATFVSAITSAPLLEPIALDVARHQQQEYVKLLRRLVSCVVELPADDRHPGGPPPLHAASLKHDGTAQRIRPLPTTNHVLQQ